MHLLYSILRRWSSKCSHDVAAVAVEAVPKINIINKENIHCEEIGISATIRVL